ncbi:MAG: SIS domain-containing protein [Nitrososphaeria archaeon]|nr:SIS domain-containing protein [Nitrososphaeria archaeon]
MHKIYDDWPRMAIDAYNIKPKSRNYKNIDHIVFAGMGGSGAIGDLFSAILSKTNIHVSLVKGYVLPKTVDSNTLVVTVSISGNTIETLTVLKSAKKIGCKVIAFSSGGKMESLCKKNNIDFQKINLTHSPRASFINYVYSILRTLETIMPIKKQDILQSISDLTNLSKQIRSSNLTEHNPSLSIAKWITGIPLIYYPWGLQAIAVRFKSSLQENAKSHAIIEDVIEASHNGIMSWERSSSVRPILLQGQDDYIKTKERWVILKEYFNKNSIDYLEIKSPKGSILTKLVCLIYMLDYASVYCAVINKTDPSPVKSIDFVKKRL